MKLGIVVLWLGLCSLIISCYPKQQPQPQLPVSKYGVLKMDFMCRPIQGELYCADLESWEEWAKKQQKQKQQRLDQQGF